MSQLARDKVTIFDKKLPRVEIALSRLKRLHAKILRRFAETPGFLQDAMTVRIKLKYKGRLEEFGSVRELCEWASDSAEKQSPQALELTYQYAAMQTPYEVRTMNASVQFGEQGRNECYITSNDPAWADATHLVVREELLPHSRIRLGTGIKHTAFVVGALSILMFGAELFPFSSNEGLTLIGSICASVGVVAWPIKSYPFNKITENRIFLS